ncbi:MAG: pyruvate synthase subunit PorA [Candidatus Thermoplasmatota archaeon]|nr:pyruvate synthase subunit PorA [Candidatus Thermoplasmatota archaeon]
MKVVVEGNHAAALAAKLCKVQVVPAYPITPSTHIPEKISEYVANGELKAEFILAESEHSALSACIGASAAGARTCTCTSSQGLALMHELLFIASGMRLPIIMPVGNRALSSPINIWCDHQDSISERDSGWLQFYCESNQEVLDFTIMAFKIAEDANVLLPAMLGLDAFVLTHTSEVVEAPEQSEVDKFLPPYKPPFTLDPKSPKTFGSFCTPEYYMEFKKKTDEAMHRASEVIDKVFAEFKAMFGREYKKVKSYCCEDAEIIILTLGTMSGTARMAVSKLRAKGEKVGCASLTVYRPFPSKELIEVARTAKVLAIVDRNISLGFAGAVFEDVCSCFVNHSKKPLVLNYILGLGGRDVLIEDFELIVESAKKALKTNKFKIPEWIGLREELI